MLPHPKNCSVGKTFIPGHAVSPGCASWAIYCISVVCQGSLGKSQGTVYMYNAEEQAAKPRLTPKPSLPFLSYNTDTADLIVETNALWRERDTEASISFQTPTVMVEQGLHHLKNYCSCLLWVGSQICLQKGQIFSVVKTGQGVPTPAAQVNFLMPSVIWKKRWIDIRGLIKFHAGMVEFCSTLFTIILCSRNDSTEIHGGHIFFFEQGKNELKTSTK